MGNQKISQLRLSQMIQQPMKSKLNAGIERWLMIMQGKYEYKVTYRPRKNPENPADYMFRYALERILPNTLDLGRGQNSMLI